ncbi:MAG: anti-sigma factor family protein [Ktedonobacterales bacterium]
MTCAQAQKDLQLYIDGRLDQRRYSMVETHLDACPRCRHDLVLYEIMHEVLSQPSVEREPDNLTNLIMARIANAEQPMSVTSAQPFGWRWRDALLAALLGTASTLLFLLINPTLGTPFFMNLSHTFPVLVSLVQAEGPDSIPWIAWVIWIMAGAGLALWLAGAEVRAAWKRSLTNRLQTRLQLPELW